MPDEIHEPWAYVAWLRDLEQSLEQPGGETPRILLIDAPSAGQAREWGDDLVLRALRTQSRLAFVRSGTHALGGAEHADDPSWATTPRCELGQDLPPEVVLAAPRDIGGVQHT